MTRKIVKIKEKEIVLQSSKLIIYVYDSLHFGWVSVKVLYARIFYLIWSSAI